MSTQGLSRLDHAVLVTRPPQGLGMRSLRSAFVPKVIFDEISSRPDSRLARKIAGLLGLAGLRGTSPS